MHCQSIAHYTSNLYPHLLHVELLEHLDVQVAHILPHAGHGIVHVSLEDALCQHVDARTGCGRRPTGFGPV